jgi:hypothetical protein
MNRRLPTLAVVLGVAGLVPFAVCAFTALTSADPARAARFVASLIDYGAVILSFLGGAQWGFVLGSAPPEVLTGSGARTGYRLVLGVSASLVGWLALLVLLLGWEAPALAVLIAGFVVMMAAESELRGRGLMPAGYTVMRWGLSIVVILILATTLTLRLLQARLTF